MVSAAVIAAANLRWYPPTGSWNLDRNDLAPWTGVAIAAVWMAMLALGETYDSEVMGAGTEEMRKVALSGFTTAAVTAITLYLVKFPLSRIFFVLTIVLGILFLLVGRLALRGVVRSMRRKGHLTHRVLVAGHPARIGELARVLAGDTSQGYEVVGALTRTSDDTVGGLPVVGRVEDLPQVATSLNIESVIVAEGAFPTARGLRRTAWALADSGIHLVVAPGLQDVAFDRLSVRPVLRGDMSLVGPRPPLPREVADYEQEALRRLRVHPGITGLWQVSGRSDLSWEESVRIDLYYVDNWSPVTDILILLRTVRAVVTGKGAY